MVTAFLLLASGFLLLAGARNQLPVASGQPPVALTFEPVNLKKPRFLNYGHPFALEIDRGKIWTPYHFIR
jgi:hypothetical protein